MERKSEHQLICKKARCRNALDAKPDFGRFHAPSSVSSAPVRASKNVDFIDPKWAPRTRLDKWRVLAVEISLSALHCATCKWEGGSFERIEAENRRALKAHFVEQARRERAEVAADGEFADPDWREVISPDGARCLVTRFREVSPKSERPPIPADLTIPEFLRR
jgi:hypothetical protein